MEINRMLEVVRLRFKSLNPMTRVIGEDKFIIEMDNLPKTGRITIKAKVELDNEPQYVSITGLEISRDEILVNEVKKVIKQALI